MSEKDLSKIARSFLQNRALELYKTIPGIISVTANSGGEIILTTTEKLNDLPVLSHKGTFLIVKNIVAEMKDVSSEGKIESDGHVVAATTMAVEENSPVGPKIQEVENQKKDDKYFRHFQGDSAKSLGITEAVGPQSVGVDNNIDDVTGDSPDRVKAYKSWKQRHSAVSKATADE